MSSIGGYGSNLDPMEYSYNIQIISKSAEQFAQGKIDAGRFKLIVAEHIGVSKDLSITETLEHLSNYIARVQQIINKLPISAYTAVIKQDMDSLETQMSYFEKNPRKFGLWENLTSNPADAAEKVKKVIGNLDWSGKVLEPEMDDDEIFRLKVRQMAGGEISNKELEILKEIGGKSAVDAQQRAQQQQMEQQHKARFEAEQSELKKRAQEQLKQQEELQAKQREELLKLQTQAKQIEEQQAARQKEEQDEFGIPGSDVPPTADKS